MYFETNVLCFPLETDLQEIYETVRFSSTSAALASNLKAKVSNHTSIIEFFQQNKLDQSVFGEISRQSGMKRNLPNDEISLSRNTKFVWN